MSGQPVANISTKYIPDNITLQYDLRKKKKTTEWIILLIPFFSPEILLQKLIQKWWQALRTDGLAPFLMPKLILPLSSFDEVVNDFRYSLIKSDIADHV